MNKVIVILLVAVCALGMALIMLNERLRKPEPATPAGIIAPVTPPDAAPPVAPGNPVSAVGTTAGTQPQPYLPPQSQAGIPDRNASSEAPARAPIPSLKPDDRTAPVSGLASSEPQPAVAKPVVQPKPATPVTEKTTAAAEPAREKPAKAAPQHKTITKFVVLARDKGATLRLVGAAPIVYKNMQLSGPERLVIDLDGKWQVKAPGVPKNPAVTNVRLGKDGDKTRIVIDLSGKVQPKFTLSKDGHTLDIRLDH